MTIFFYNKKYNLISKNTENQVWLRHILIQLNWLRFIIDFKSASISDLGSGAGFPGIILAIFYEGDQISREII